MPKLIVVSNRTPGKAPAAGGLAVALKKVLESRDGFWFGWSGKFDDHPSRNARFEDIDGTTVAKIDLTKGDHHGYYAGFSNSVLWPAFHLRLDLTSFNGPWYEAYRRVNVQFARALLPHIEPGDLIWVHDYHLIPLGHELRALGVKNRIGFYLHIPFPTPDALLAIPHHIELMRDLGAYDVVGFQAGRDVGAIREFLDHQAPTSLSGAPRPDVDMSSTVLAPFPIGSDPEAFARLSRSPTAKKMITRMQRVLANRSLILGVDRLDYSKGLPQRVSAYEKLLENNTALRREVHMVQIAPPSRDSIREYQEINHELDTAVGRVIGRFAEPDWQPLTYVKRAYGQSALAGLFRLARVGLVTPLRDGMNLVAHEYIASQDPDDPGVLILSRFAGAAEIFPDAIIVNPFDTDETAEAIRLALVMPLEERKARWRKLMRAARRHNIADWAEDFIGALAAESAPRSARRASATRRGLDGARTDGARADGARADGGADPRLPRLDVAATPPRHHWWPWHWTMSN